MCATILAAVLALLSNEPDTTCFKNCTPSDAGIQFTANFEGYSPFVYGDPVKIKTIGYGHVIKPGEKFKEPLLPPDAFLLLHKDADIAARGVNKVVGVTLHQSQFDALNDFQFNTGALGKSTLLKRINANRVKDVPAQFLRWDKAQGVTLKGLHLRRQAEATLYTGGK